MLVCSQQGDHLESSTFLKHIPWPWHAAKNPGAFLLQHSPKPRRAHEDEHRARGDPSLAGVFCLVPPMVPAHSLT